MAVEEFVERECLLFEAGEYADKGVTVTEDDLRAIAANSGGEIPVKIEHLAESPFDSALGVVTRLRAVGRQLWGTLRQSPEAWSLAQRAGARSLSVGLDVVGRRLVETSFVCHPRVASAQVFREVGNRHDARNAMILNRRDAEGVERREERGVVRFDAPHALIPWLPLPNLGEGEICDGEVCLRREEGKMSGVRQLAEGLMSSLRSFLGEDSSAAAEFAEARSELERERTQFRAERVEQQLMEWKRQGRLRASENAEQLARTLLSVSDTHVASFDGHRIPVSIMFARFLEENGPVVPMGERLAADRHTGLGGGGDARERLIALAQEKARSEGLSYVQAFASVSTAHPELAQAAREE